MLSCFHSVSSEAEYFKIYFQVFVNLRGTLGRINKQHLMKEIDEDYMETDEIFQFKRATSERFTISGVDIGDLISVEIEVSSQNDRDIVPVLP